MHKVRAVLRLTFCVISFFMYALFAFAAGRAASTIHGYEAYRNKDWNSAIIFLRQSVNTPSEVTPEILYMLIQSEMNAKDFKSAMNDCVLFLSSYPKNTYRPIVMFQKAKAAFNLERYNDSILLFSEFCNENVGSALYPSALYWIAESFYAMYDFDSAKEFYERIVKGFSEDAKKEDSERRLEEIAHWEREEKLLYLLKVTGEEYLAAKEEYERELKLYKNSDIDGLKQKLREYSERISELEARNAELESAATDAMSAVKRATNTAGTATATSPSRRSDSENITAINTDATLSETDIKALKEKALRLQEILDNNGGM